MVDGLGANATTASSYSKMLGELDLGECLAALAAESSKLQAGDLSVLETSLLAQAVTLNAMFTQYSYQATTTTNMDHIDRLTRLGLKAQSQFRATVEALHAIKHPPLMFVRQANIAQGPQQVNNNVTLSAAKIPESEQSKLLEAHDERLDSRAAPSAGTGDQDVAALGALDRASNFGRQGALL